MFVIINNHLVLVTTNAHIIVTYTLTERGHYVNEVNVTQFDPVH